MNASFFIFWNQVQQIMLPLAQFMQPRINQKLSTQERSVQVFLWSFVTLSVAYPAMKFCELMANLSPIPMVQTSWLLVGMAFGIAGLLGAFALLAGIPLVCVLFAVLALKKWWR